MRMEPVLTLVRGATGRFDQDRMVVLFSMTDGLAEILCAISTEALDRLDSPLRVKPDQREQRFERLRDGIEVCAIRKFNSAEFEGNPRRLVLRGIDFR